MDAIVIGAGISGLSTAWALTKRGHRVTLLEQGAIPNPLAASGDHHRIIRRAYGAGTGYGQAITEAYGAWDELWDDLGQVHLDPRGFLCISRKEGDEAEEYLHGLRQGGWPHEVIEAEDAVRRWPFLEPETFRYAFLSPEGGALHCRKIASSLAEWLRANGGDVREHSRVSSVDCVVGTATLADGTTLQADQIIVTAGAWVTKLFPDLVSELTTKRTAVVYLEPPADLKVAWRSAPVILDVGGDTDGYIVPPSGGGGLKFGTGLHKIDNPDADANRLPVGGEGEMIRDHFSPPLSRLDEYRVINVVTCAYTFTEDETFFGERRDRCIIVSAGSGHGYKFGAAVGRRVADAVESDDVETLRKWLRAEVF